MAYGLRQMCIIQHEGKPRAPEGTEVLDAQETVAISWGDLSFP